MTYEPPKSRNPRYSRRQKYECTVHPNGINIPFSAIFNRNLANIDNVRLVGKKTFLHIAESVAWTLSRILSDERCNIHLEYLRVLTNIRTYRVTYTASIDNLKRDIFVGNPETNTPALLNPEVIAIIQDIQDSIYIDELDERSSKEAKVITELQITDRHAKEILKIAMACRFLAPILCEFIEYSGLTSDYVLFEIFVSIYPFMTPPDIDLISKTSKFIESRVLPTMSQDAYMWSFYERRGEDTFTLIGRIHRELITNIIPKLENRVVGYINESIIRQIQFFFQTHHGKIRYQPCKLWDTSKNTDALDGFDRHSTAGGRNQELYQSVDALSIKIMIDGLVNRYGVIEPVRLQYYKEVVGTNECQKRLLFTFYAKTLGDYQSLYNIDNDTYFRMLVYLHQYLKTRGLMPSICSLLIAIPKVAETELTSRISQRLSSSTGFRNLLESRYSFIRYEISNSETIGELLALMTAEYYETPSFEEWCEIVKRGEHERFEFATMNISPERMCNELIDLIRM